VLPREFLENNYLVLSAITRYKLNYRVDMEHGNLEIQERNRSTVSRWVYGEKDLKRSDGKRRSTKQGNKETNGHPCGHLCSEAGNPHSLTTTTIIAASEVTTASIVTTTKVRVVRRAPSVGFAVLAVTTVITVAAMTKTTAVTEPATMPITAMAITIASAMVPAAVLELVFNTTQSCATEGTEADSACCGSDGDAPLVLLGRRGVCRLLSGHSVLLLGRILSLLRVARAVMGWLGGVMGRTITCGADASTTGGSSTDSGGRETVLGFANHLAQKAFLPLTALATVGAYILLARARAVAVRLGMVLLLVLVLTLTVGTRWLGTWARGVAVLLVRRIQTSAILLLLLWRVRTALLGRAVSAGASIFLGLESSGQCSIVLGRGMRRRRGVSLTCALLGLKPGG
jgi:hypothetical protein